MKIIKINHDVTMKPTWDIEVEEVHEYLLGNGCVSHNTSGKAANATESIEPVQNFFYKEDGTTTIPTLAPNFKKNGAYYVKAFDCDQVMLLKHGAIQQIYLDQSQSLNMYIGKPDSLLQLSKLHFLAFKLGIKTLYYVKSLKAGEEEICESCS